MVATAFLCLFPSTRIDRGAKWDVAHLSVYGYVPVELADVGTQLKVELPDAYAESPGQAANAEVCDVPFRPSVNPSAREKAKERGRDHAD